MARLCSSLLLSLLIASSASAVTMTWTPIGNPGNPTDPNPDVLCRPSVPSADAATRAFSADASDFGTQEAA